MLVINAFTHDTRVEKEARTLVGAGHEVGVFALHSVGLAESETRDGYRVVRIRIRSRAWGTHLAIRLLKYLELCIRAICRLTRCQPAVVHAHDVNALIPAYVSARLSRALLVYDAHELWADRRSALLRWDLLRRLVRVIEGALARRSDAVITVNSSIADLLAQRYSLSRPVVLMHCQEHRPIERSDILREELGIRAGDRIVVYAGLFAPGRGLESLIGAAPYLDRAVVVLMGQDRMDGELQDLIAARGLRDRVFIRQPVPPDDVTRYVASADVGVMPTQSVDLSYHYGLGNKLFHYLTAGIPAAVSDQPEKRRIIEIYRVGTVFDQTDPQDIARSINRLLNDGQSYALMCQRAREVSRDLLNWGVESRKLLGLYDRLLSVDPTSQESH